MKPKITPVPHKSIEESLYGVASDRMLRHEARQPTPSAPNMDPKYQEIQALGELPPHPSASEYAERRRRVASQLADGAVALIAAGEEARSSERFRQINDFQYLSGVEVPHAYLIIEGNGNTTLYLAERNHTRYVPSQAKWVCEKTGIETVEPIEALLPRLESASHAYLPHLGEEGARVSWDNYNAWTRAIAADPLDERRGRNAEVLHQLQSRYPELKIDDLSPILAEMRLIKSPSELALLKRAGELTALGTLAAMRATRPNCYEYELQAELEHVFVLGGSRGVGYAPIIPGSENAGDPHYLANRSLLKDGDIVLLDCAPDFRYYTSDIGRMWPVNGRFSEEQAALYGFVLAYHKALIEKIKPGAMKQEIQEAVAQEMRPVFEQWSFTSPEQKETAEILFNFKGHISHGVGMCVHDVSQHESRPFEPGMVFAVDPMAWDDTNKTYYRVEDTVVITEYGCENLTASCPIEIEDIEAVMAAGK